MHQPGMGESPPLTAYKFKVELRISCNNLLDKDLFSKSDPLCALYTLQNQSWVEHGRTEEIPNNLNPQFAKTFEVYYYFEEVQKLRFSVYDIDNATQSLDDADYFGAIECTLGHIVSKKVITLPLKLKNGEPAGNGTITILSEKLGGNNEVVTLQFMGSNLEEKDFFGKSDPYLEIFRQSSDGKWSLAHRTDVIKDTLTPFWKPFNIYLLTLCGGNYDETLQIKIWDWDNDGSPDFIGEFQTNFRRFLEASTSTVEWDCIDPKQKEKKGEKYNNSGVINLVSCKLETEYTFLDHILSGCEIKFTVAIDFTASNKDPTDPESLHFVSPTQPNEYLKALRSVGKVCQDYDTDKLFPGLGFGALIPPKYLVTHHDFPLNLNIQSPYCEGVEGLEAAYKSCMYEVRLDGPTKLAPVINNVAKIARDNVARDNSAKSYFILLILTDGVISDLDNTRDAIVVASRLPMSIIIVGVGGEDFTDMNLLDGDKVLLVSTEGQQCERDIVQFVPFRKFQNESPEALAKFVLAEVPIQLTGYFKNRNIPPNPKQQPPEQMAAQGQAPPPPPSPPKLQCSARPHSSSELV